MRKRRVILNTLITDLMNIRILVDSHSNVRRIKRTKDKISLNNQPNHSLKKVLKADRHK